MSKKDTGANEAKQARIDENARQARIRAGTQRINGIFDGAPAGALTPVAPTGGAMNWDSGEYYDANGNRLHGTVGSFGRADEAFTKTATATPGQFTDDFFNGRKQAYLNYADPQLQDQYGDANRQLTFSLARSGLLDSSARGQKLGELQKLYDTQKQAIADKALSYETGARNSVEDARSNLIQTLNATGDAEGAANSALARSQALSAPDAYSPLAQLFTDFTNGLGIQAAQERSYAAGGAKPLYNTGLFSNAGRVSVTN